MQLVDWLDDLCVRFIINLPREELESVERICFQVEEAQWFYEDFIRPLDPTLPSLNLRNFSLRIFQHCPMLSEWSTYHHSAAFAEFLAYKTRVPVRGAIMLNEAMDQVVLVKGWKKSANWSFPRGKINKDEKDLDCAVREVYEETGYDIQAAGLVGEEKDAKFIEVTMREQHMRLYVFRGVPMDTHFEPRTRKEISKIEWYKLSDLPTLKKKPQDAQDLVSNSNKFYMVAPFLGPLRKWISQQKKHDVLRGSYETRLAPNVIKEEPMTESEEPEVEMEHSQMRNEYPLHTPSNLPEVSISRPATQQDATVHLKQLLQVNSMNPPLSEAESLQNTNANMTPSNSLLALLRNGADSAEINVQRGSKIPRTPLEQFSSPPKMLQTPHHHHPLDRPLSNLPPPPAYPFPSAQNVPIPPHQLQTGFSLNHGAFQPGYDRQPEQNLVQNSGPVQYPAHVPSIRPSFPQNHWPQATVGASSQPQILAATSSPSLGGLHERHPAPYQRTGDPQFANLPQFPNLHVPSIPMVSRLPPPKLTSQSLALLNTFKNGHTSVGKGGGIHTTVTQQMESVTKPRDVSISTADEELWRAQGSANQRASAVSTISSQTGAQGRQGLAVPLQEVSAVSGGAKELHSDAEGLDGVIKQGLSITEAPVTGPRPRSQHQETLLNLFRKPSVVAAGAEAGLAAERGPVELSANPSTLPVGQGGPIKIAKRPSPRLPKIKTASSLKSRSPRDSLTSATVSGPLNQPQFDNIVRSVSRRISGTSSNTDTTVKPSSRVPRVTILPRRLVDTAQAVNVPPTLLENKSAPPKKEFQPQILRRPAQGTSEISPVTSKPSKSQSRPEKPTDNVTHELKYDRRESQTEAQKKNLLSLFQKSAVTGPSPITATSIASPPVAASPHSLVSPLQNDQKISIGVGITPPTRSRIGSLTSAVPNSAAGPPTPSSTTSAEDKKFLLGFLGDFARGGQ